MDKLITFAIPCYNSEAYMENCIKSLLDAGDDTEILIINDGSKDGTGAIADKYQSEYPDKIRAVHQENGGHGEGVNQGIRLGRGMYYKVVDSDDRLDPTALNTLLTRMRENVARGIIADMYVTNYVYDHVEDGTQRSMSYSKKFPHEKLCNWENIKSFGVSQYLMMHSVIYRMEMLREIGTELPKHTFYVDNLYMYHPFPHVKNIYYMDLDLYYYFIGRDDQSVNKANMIKRIDQQILVTQLMTKCYDLSGFKKTRPKLHKYMLHELSLMYMISNVFLFASKDKANYEKSKQLWKFLKENADEDTYKSIKWRSLNTFTRLPGPIGRGVTVAGYNISKKIFKYN